MQNRMRQLEKGFQTAYICSDMLSEQVYCPDFLFNEKSGERTVLSALEEELSECEEFLMSIAFITKGGVKLLKPIFKELEEKNVKGRIMTTDYQGIGEPEAWKELSELKNIELKVYPAKENGGFHTKGYIFKKNGLYRVIIGSSNMTNPALTKNKEWNIRFITTSQGRLIKNILQEYENMWKKSKTIE